MGHDEKDKQALDYHAEGRPGKIEVKPTKACITAQDLALAYTPGVAAPCLEIEKNPAKAYEYTAKGNLVAVISNGTAVLGLGNIGPLAGKPVMEGKGVLFKRFADIDVFDIEVNETTVEGMVKAIQAIGPTFGGINLEDIKAPECFEIEKQLIETMDIPVFHDDQHGTAIIAAAGFINALEITKRNIKDVKVTFSGAGAAAMACAQILIELGVERKNLVLCDSKGVIYKGRKEGMNKYKEQFAVETKLRTLKEAMAQSDAFIGCSARGVVDQAMVKSMKPNPIIFAMANPIPEIYPNEVAEVRSDALMATGRSDFPNQVNNVLGFPFIFRGALDVRAKRISKEMKLAAVYALADLAKETVPEEVKMAYGNQDFTFGPEYFIPKPFDPRMLARVAPAVAKAAMESGVAANSIDDLDAYAMDLQNRLGTSASFMKMLRDRLQVKVNQSGKPIDVVFAEGANDRVLEAIKLMMPDQTIRPILLGDKEFISSQLEKVGLEEEGMEIITPEDHPKFQQFVQEYKEENQRKGVNFSLARERMGQENYFGAKMLKEKVADVLMTGPGLTYPQCFGPIMKVLGTSKKEKACGVYILVFQNRILFLADCTVQISPNAEDLAKIAMSSAELFESLMHRPPNIAFLSFSSFGSNRHPNAKRVAQAVELAKSWAPKLQIDGEIQADVAVNENLLKNLFSFSDLKGETDILIFPDLSSANISYKLLSQLSDCKAIGPILAPLESPANIIPRTASVQEIVNLTLLMANLSAIKS